MKKLEFGTRVKIKGIDIPVYFGKYIDDRCSLYWFIENDPFPKWLYLKRDEFKLAKESSEKHYLDRLLQDMEEAPF